MTDIKFGGAAPDGDDVTDMVQQIVDACRHYAAQAREAMHLHASKRIAVAVPVDAVKRPFFELAEPILWDMNIRLDWSAYTTWVVPHSLAEGFEPNDLIGYRQHPSAGGPEGGWRVTPRARRMPFSMTPAEARAFAARLLAAADAADEHNRQMPAPPPAGAVSRSGMAVISPVDDPRHQAAAAEYARARLREDLTEMLAPPANPADE
jgi:hypothetical protein